MEDPLIIQIIFDTELEQFFSASEREALRKAFAMEACAVTRDSPVACLEDPVQGDESKRKYKVVCEVRAANRAKTTSRRKPK